MTLRSFSLALGLAAAVAAPAHAATDWGAVATALGKSGTLQAGGVYRVGLPRSDLKVTLDGVQIKPALALGSWVAFRDTGGGAEVMGDLVLTHGEVNPVMTALEENGIEITALHNHLLRSSPATMYMHIDGRGDAVKLASALHSALSRSGTPLGPSAPPPRASPIDLDTAMIDRTLGAKGTIAGGVYQVSIPRVQAPAADGMPIPPPIGSATAINFQPTGGGRAAVTGDFVLTADEVNPVIRALRSGGIEVTAIHNHMLNEEPRLFFMHFWANQDAARLARTLRSALDRVKLAR